MTNEDYEMLRQEQLKEIDRLYDTIYANMLKQSIKIQEIIDKRIDIHNQILQLGLEILIYK